MALLYHSSMYADDRPVDSYWEDLNGQQTMFHGPLTERSRCDVAIIGGGFTGLAAALYLSRDYGLDVRVLEAGHVGWGASGRNGGFCCLAATKLSIGQLISKYGLPAVQHFYASQVEGINLLDSISSEEGIEFDRQGDGIFEVAHHQNRFSGLVEQAKELKRLFGINTEVFSQSEFADIGHDSTEQFGALLTTAGFGLNPLKLVHGFSDSANRHGAKIHPHSRVVDWTRTREGHELQTVGGSVVADQVIVATNGFTRDDLHKRFSGIVLPVISNILTTRPLSADELDWYNWRTENPICNTRTLLFYYRLLKDKRILFGARGDLSGSLNASDRMRRFMTKRFYELFPRWRAVSFSHFWRGFVCVTRRLTPCVGKLENDPSVWYGFGYHANGVNTAAWVGRALARNLAGDKSDAVHIPEIMSGLATPFPLPRLRLWGLRAAYIYYQLRDAW